MATVSTFDMTGKQTGTMELADSVFGIAPNATVLHSAVVNYLANQRQGTQSTLTRSEVSGGGRKPWRQKGTGHARQGSTRSPQWTHGGVALGPKPRSYRTAMNRKTKRIALYSALTAKVAEGNLIVVDDIKCEGYKTKTMATMLHKLGADTKTIVVLPEVDQFIIKSCANIPGVVTAQYNNLNVYDILNANKFVVTAAAVKMLEEVYA